MKTSTKCERRLTGAPKTQLITWEVLFSTVIFCGLFIWLNSAAETPLLIQVVCVLAVASMNDNYPDVFLKVDQSAHSTKSLCRRRKTSKLDLSARVKCTLFEDDSKCYQKKIRGGGGV